MRGSRHVNHVALIAVFVAVGCGDDSSTSPTDTLVVADGGAISSSFKSLTQYSVAMGEMSLETDTTGSATKVELLADGKVVASATTAPFTIKWDTTSQADGVVKLSLKAHGATSEEIPVVVLNNGEAVAFTEGETQTMTIVANTDTDVKVHWTMPAGVKKVIGVLFWKNAEFKLEIAIGTGNCPHSGETAASNTSDTSPVVTEFGGTTNLASVMWFSHAKVMNTGLEGKSTELTFKAFLLK